MGIIFDSNKHSKNNSLNESGAPPKNSLDNSQSNPTPSVQNSPDDINSPSLPDDPNLKAYSPAIAKLIETYRDYYKKQQSKPDVATIHVDEIASKVALFYEKVRKIVDWKEEHLVRRGAIERVLKRKMISKISGISLSSGLDPEKIAESLVLELVRGGHFQNDRIPKKNIQEVKNTLKKLAFIFENNPLEKDKPVSPKIKKKINFSNWLLEIAACEIEEILEPPIKEKALVDCMTTSMSARIQLNPENVLSETEKEIQINIAVLRTLFHLDNPIISYYLLKTYWPQWSQPSTEELNKLTQEIFLIEKKIGEYLNHSFSGQFYGLCEKYDTIYLLLGDVLENFCEKPSSLVKTLSKPKKLSSLIRSAYNKRLSTLKKRLTRSAVYSTLSVFVSGGVSLFIFEVPLARLFYGEWKPLAIFVDILLPTALMAFLVAIVKPPRKSNLERVVKETCKVVYPTKERDVYEIKARKKRGLAVRIIVGSLYLLATFVSLTFTFFAFELAKVPVTSLYVDTLNVAVIVFAALVIRQRSKELTVEEKASFWEFIIDILSVPVAEIGQWLANKWKEYNIVSVFFIALVDMPFSTFIHFIENWSSYVKEKKSEIH